MADRIEREINEILARLDDLPEPAAPLAKAPVSIADARERRRVTATSAATERRSRTRADWFNPTRLVVAGAGAVLGGFALSIVWAPLIWAAFVGVIVFIGGFIGALARPARPGQRATASAPDGHFWRDRYIKYQPSAPGTWGRFKRRFRR